jgi:hypothetical protein
MKVSEQLTLGELKIKLEAITDKKKRVFFDFDYGTTPERLTSWRGVYEEIAFTYGTNPIDVEGILRNIDIVWGKELTGWKGGEFLMGKTTPVWVANVGESSVEKYYDKTWVHVAVVGIEELEDKVRILTKEMEY